jgi:hypothetical protein
MQTSGTAILRHHLAFQEYFFCETTTNRFSILRNRRGRWSNNLRDYRKLRAISAHRREAGFQCRSKFFPEVKNIASRADEHK